MHQATKESLRCLGKALMTDVQARKTVLTHHGSTCTSRICACETRVDCARVALIRLSAGQATSTEAWIYRNRASREAIVSFRGTSDPQDMMTDACMALAAFSPGDRPDSRSPEEVANSLSQKELEQGPLGGIFKSIKVR